MIGVGAKYLTSTTFALALRLRMSRVVPPMTVYDRSGDDEWIRPSAITEATIRRPGVVGGGGLTQPVGVTVPVAAPAPAGPTLPVRDTAVDCTFRIVLLELGIECGAHEGGKVLRNGEPLVALNRKELLTCGGMTV
mmetsp:Transcript_35130/g.65560  ORF Transcript_35130/g.65560 Transcript_35130/m.65560 type:complete len:136 (+) Transcript_35130:1868-2275(+)